MYIYICIYISIFIYLFINIYIYIHIYIYNYIINNHVYELITLEVLLPRSRPWLVVADHGSISLCRQVSGNRDQCIYISWATDGQPETESGLSLCHQKWRKWRVRRVRPVRHPAFHTDMAEWGSIRWAETEGFLGKHGMGSSMGELGPIVSKFTPLNMQ